MPPQQVITRSTPMEGVERTNVVIVRGPGQEMGALPRRDFYAMEVDRGRNCYACERFGHLACYCRNQRENVTEGRRLEYRGRREKNYEHLDNLKEEENLESLD